MQEVLIIDKDHINLLLKSDYNSNIYKTKTAIVSAIFGNNKNIAHYVLGAAGSGKSTMAQKYFGGIYANNIQEILSHIDAGKPTIVINANIPDPKIAQHAENIYIFDVPDTRLRKQREYRELTNGYTNFARSVGSTTGAPTDNVLAKAILKTDFPDKTYIYKFGEEMFGEAFDKIPLAKDLSTMNYEFREIGETTGKFAPPHLGHTYMIDKILREKSIVNLIIGGDVNKHGFIGYEIECMLRKIFGEDQLSFSNHNRYGEDYFIKVGNRAIKIDRKDSVGILGKDRLPEGFDEGDFSDPRLQGFIGDNKHDIVAPLKNMSKFGTIKRAPDIKITNQKGQEIYISSSDYREFVLGKTNLSAKIVASRFDSRIAKILTDARNIQIIKRRLEQGQQMNADMKKVTEQVKSDYMQIYISKRGDSDMKTAKGAEKSFDLRTPKGENKQEKTELIQDMKIKIDERNRTIKDEYKSYQFEKLEGLDYK